VHSRYRKTTAVRDVLCVRATACPGRGAGKLTVVDESDHALGRKRIRKFMSIDRKIRQGITTDGVQDSAGIFRDHLHVTIKKDPVAW
jgi:hypothetical protein